MISLKRELIKQITERREQAVHQCIHKSAIKTMEEYASICARIEVYDEILAKIEEVDKQTQTSRNNAHTFKDAPEQRFLKETEMYDGINGF